MTTASIQSAAKPATTKQAALTEKVSHRTNGRPFSMHHTDVSTESASALYLHCHSELELFYLCEGELFFYIEDIRYHLKKGDVMLIPGGLMHYATRVTENDDPCSFDAFVFMSDLIMDTLPSYCEHYLDVSLCSSIAGVAHISFQEVNRIITTENNIISSVDNWQSQISNHLNNIFAYHSTPVEHCELAIRGELLNIWQLLYNNLYTDIITKRSSHAVYPLLNKCIDYININFTENFVLSELADMAGLSEGHFCRLFKEITGFTPFNYINRIRITKSCELLTRTNKKIADIASTCGFNNIGYFNRIFKDIMKESPSVYRNNFRNLIT